MLSLSRREVTYVPPTHLTAREVEIRDLAAGGKTNEEIAGLLGLSRRTVEAHLRMVYRKMGLTRRGDLNARRENSGGGRLQELERLLAMRERQLQSYEAAMKRIIDTAVRADLHAPGVWSVLRPPLLAFFAVVLITFATNVTSRGCSSPTASPARN